MSDDQFKWGLGDWVTFLLLLFVAIIVSVAIIAGAVAG